MMAIEQVRPAALDAWLDADARPAVVLDVREANEWAAAAVAAPAGARIVRIAMSTMPASLDALDPAEPVAVLCHHGARSQRVAMHLAQAGFERVANIAGGIDAWSLERDPAVPRY